MIREESKMLWPILIAAGSLLVTCRAHDVDTIMPSSIQNVTSRPRSRPISSLEIPEGRKRQESKSIVLPSSQERNSSHTSQRTQQKSKKGAESEDTTNANLMPQQNIRHNKQRRGRGKGRGRGRGKGKGKHRNRSKSKDPSSQHSHIRRNMEKEVLVQNRTLELLGGGGARILWANGGINGTVPTQNDSSFKSYSNVSTSPVNLISSKKNSSTRGILVGLLIRNNTAGNFSSETNERTSKSKLKLMTSSRTVGIVTSRINSTKSVNTTRRGGYPLKFGRDGDLVISDYQYDYDAIETPEIIESAVWFNSGQSKTDDSVRDGGRISQTGDVNTEGGLDPGPLQAALGTTLARVLGVLTGHGGSNASHKEEDEEDPCERWMRCKDKLEKAFLGPLGTLPSCPCHYPSAIFYDDKIWDQSQGKYFRWRDVSGEAERLDVYKPGAAYCIRSLLAQGSTSLAAQHCCYDRYRRLLTRGSGAGTPDFVSPEVSASLHEKVDVLPWRLCKGDFTRYNSVRPPNNDNNCTENPNNEEYQQQVQIAQYF